MNSSFEVDQEYVQRKADALDKVRTEIQRQLRKYSRRMKAEAEAYAKAALTLDPNADPEEVADEAVRRGSQGMFALNGGVRAVAPAEPK